MDNEVSKTLNCMHEAGRVLISSVDFYNFTTNDETHIALRSLNADKEHQGGYRRVLAMDGDKWKPRKSYRPRQGGNGFGINVAILN